MKKIPLLLTKKNKKESLWPSTPSFAFTDPPKRPQKYRESKGMNYVSRMILGYFGLDEDLKKIGKF